MMNLDRLVLNAIPKDGTSFKLAEIIEATGATVGGVMNSIIRLKRQGHFFDQRVVGSTHNLFCYLGNFPGKDANDPSHLAIVRGKVHPLSQAATLNMGSRRNDL